jgi:hypothetical protein
MLGAGFCVGKGMYLIKSMSRTVSVKGIAEQEVKSDLGIWEINYRQIGNDLVQINQNLHKDEESIITFLKQQGFKSEEISRSQFKLEDRLATIYNTSSTNSNDPRYVVTAGLRVRSTQVDLIEKTSQTIDQLISQGVSLTFDSTQINPNPSFYFTHLDDIRAPMLSAATKSATNVAQQFAADANSKLSGIQHANQGVFQIMSSDTSTLSSDWNSNQSALGSIQKKVRLVTSLEFILK